MCDAGARQKIVVIHRAPVISVKKNRSIKSTAFSTPRTRVLDRRKPLPCSFLFRLGIADGNLKKEKGVQTESRDRSLNTYYKQLAANRARQGTGAPQAKTERQSRKKKHTGLSEAPMPYAPMHQHRSSGIEMMLEITTVHARSNTLVRA